MMTHYDSRHWPKRLPIRSNLRFEIDEYRKAVEAHPFNADIANTLGDLYLRAGEVRQAITFFTRVAELYRANGFMLKSIAVLKKISRVDPTDTDASVRIGDLFAKQGLIAEARLSYKSAGDSKYQGGELKGAIDAYKKLLALGASNAASFAKLAEMCSEYDLLEDAHQYFVQARTRYLQTGQTDMARDMAVKARQLELVGHVFSGSREKRREERYPLRLRTLVISETREWREYTESLDVSKSGIRFNLVRPVDWGSIIQVQLPMPSELRHNHGELSTYAAQAMVCRCEAMNGAHLVAAEFGMASAPMAE